MYVHREELLIYLANPRTASRATAQALQEVGFELVGSHHSGLAPAGIEVSFSKTLVFSAVRDLKGTLESWGRHLDVAPCHVLAKMKTTNQRGIIPGWPSWTLFPHARVSDVLLRYDTLLEDLNQLLQEHGLGPVELPRVEGRR